MCDFGRVVGIGHFGGVVENVELCGIAVIVQVEIVVILRNVRISWIEEIEGSLENEGGVMNEGNQ